MTSLAEEVRSARPTRTVSRRLIAALATVALLIVAGGAYLMFGISRPPSSGQPLPQAQTRGAPATPHGTGGQQMDAMIQRVRERLAADPNDLKSWVVLARTYYATGRIPEAAGAFEQAVALAPDNPDLLADYADTLGITQGKSLHGKPETLIMRALKANPRHWKANALAGTIAFENKEYAKAVAYWERTRVAVPPGSPIAESIERSIDEARGLGNLPAAKELQ